MRNADGSLQATIGDDQFTRLWDNQGRLNAALYGHRDTVLDAAFSDDRHTLATVSRDGALIIWDTNPDRSPWKSAKRSDSERTPDQWVSYITDLPYRSIFLSYSGELPWRLRELLRYTARVDLMRDDTNGFALRHQLFLEYFSDQTVDGPGTTQLDLPANRIRHCAVTQRQRVDVPAPP